MNKKNKELPKLENRAYVCEVRAEKDEYGARIVGRPIVYESKTDLEWFTETIKRGALDNSDLTDVRFLVNHDLNRIPLARSRRNNANSTMRLNVDYEGMEIDVNLDTENNTEARNLYSAVARGDITGMSFMFSIEGEEWSDLQSEKPHRDITQIGSVIEVSAVTFPAYEATEINARDSREALENARRALESARNSLENESKPIDYKVKAITLKMNKGE